MVLVVFSDKLVLRGDTNVAPGPLQFLVMVCQILPRLYFYFFDIGCEDDIEGAMAHEALCSSLIPTYAEAKASRLVLNRPLDSYKRIKMPTDKRKEKFCQLSTVGRLTP